MRSAQITRCVHIRNRSGQTSRGFAVMNRYRQSEVIRQSDALSRPIVY